MDNDVLRLIAEFLESRNLVQSAKVLKEEKGKASLLNNQENIDKLKVILKKLVFNDKIDDVSSPDKTDTEEEQEQEEEEEERDEEEDEEEDSPKLTSKHYSSVHKTSFQKEKPRTFGNIDKNTNSPQNKHSNNISKKKTQSFKIVSEDSFENLTDPLEENETEEEEPSEGENLKGIRKSQISKKDVRQIDEQIKNIQQKAAKMFSKLQRNQNFDNDEEGSNKPSSDTIISSPSLPSLQQQQQQPKNFSLDNEEHHKAPSTRSSSPRHTSSAFQTPGSQKSGKSNVSRSVSFATSDDISSEDDHWKNDDDRGYSKVPIEYFVPSSNPVSEDEDEEDDDEVKLNEVQMKEVKNEEEEDENNDNEIVANLGILKNPLKRSVVSKMSSHVEEIPIPPNVENENIDYELPPIDNDKSVPVPVDEEDEETLKSSLEINKKNQLKKVSKLTPEVRVSTPIYLYENQFHFTFFKDANNDKLSSIRENVNNANQFIHLHPEKEEDENFVNNLDNQKEIISPNPIGLHYSDTIDVRLPIQPDMEQKEEQQQQKTAVESSNPDSDGPVLVSNTTTMISPNNLLMLSGNNNNTTFAVGNNLTLPTPIHEQYEQFELPIISVSGRTGLEAMKDFPIQIGGVIAGRYQIIEYLGSAAFSSAVRCLDTKNNFEVCVKIIKNNKEYMDQSLDEIKLLRYINANCDPDVKNVLRLFEYFYHKEHLFIVTELLRDNLYEFYKFNRESGEELYFTIDRIRSIARQCLEALHFIHSLKLIHCDLKPENILIRSYSRCLIKIIDFGSSCYQNDHLSTYVQSRSYRAPEVILGCQYSQKIDIWSLGCILPELYTGKVLFENESVPSLLARMIGVLGSFKPEMLEQGAFTSKYFKHNILYETNENGEEIQIIPKRTNLKARLKSEDLLFEEFVTMLLKQDPKERPTAGEALQHPFLQPQPTVVML